MSFQEVIGLIESNSSFVLKETKKILLKVSDNILKDPQNPKYRTLKKSNAVVMKNVLSLRGGREALLFMGFEENESTFTFPTGKGDIDKLRKFRENLSNWDPSLWNPVAGQCNEMPSAVLSADELLERIATPISLPPLTHRYTNPFFQRIAETFHNALVYGNRELQQRAKMRIPVAKLEMYAQKKMRDMQNQMKDGNHVDVEICIQDLLIVELLKWFKEEFFHWVDSPDCEACGSKTVFSHINNIEEKLMLYTTRIEMYECSQCKEFTAFPRYEDLNILLETRKGRCGEWANVFTLMCCSMGWDARKVVDETDHVWTEVYSLVQKRWIHCDPCDNACDTPLMYEHGWKKSLSYIIAYSSVELQDVTWRYSSNHKEILKRRKNCSESELVELIVELRTGRLATLSPVRRNYLLNRTVAELAELLIEKKPRDEEMCGRTSGSLDWRVARGEISEVRFIPNKFTVTKTQIDNMKYEIRYSCALDRYEVSGEPRRVIEKWETGIFEQENMMRKEENDWKQVYLCRKEGTDSGIIKWKLVLDNCAKSIASVCLKMECKTFENGKITVHIKGDNGFSTELPPENHLKTDAFKGSRQLIIRAEFSAGKGPLAWQHAQLFRQSVDSSDYPFKISLTFQ